MHNRCSAVLVALLAAANLAACAGKSVVHDSETNLELLSQRSL
jgi:hypothetical protein